MTDVIDTFGREKIFSLHILSSRRERVIDSRDGGRRKRERYSRAGDGEGLVETEGNE